MTSEIKSEKHLSKMSRINNLKKLDIRSRNTLRNILAEGGVGAISKLSKLRSKLGIHKAEALENVLLSNTPILGATPFSPFPKYPSFKDHLRTPDPRTLDLLLAFLEKNVDSNRSKLFGQIASLHEIDNMFAQGTFAIEPILLSEHITKFGWSHAILRRIILVRESQEEENDEIERLLFLAGLTSNNTVVTSAIQAFGAEQNYLTIKRAALNIADRGNLNWMSRSASRLIFQPFAEDTKDLFAFLRNIYRSSLLDGITLINFNKHLFDITVYPEIEAACTVLEQGTALNGILRNYLDDDFDVEYRFLQQSGVWLEYPLIRSYRILVDNFFDASRTTIGPLHPTLQENLENWVGNPSIGDIATKRKITNHCHEGLSTIEATGKVTRSAIFNLWLYATEGQIDVDRKNLLHLMGITRDLSRTVPINATRALVKLSNDEQVKLILLLLLAKRSKNEKDHYLLRRLLERLSKQLYDGSLIKLVSSYEKNFPDVSDYIYEIATEDFLAKCNGIAPHLSDIPEIRAQLHEWAAKHTNNEYYIERARAVRIDHQLNRVRNEIDDHRIYVDPSRFSSWIGDEIMLELSGALTVVGQGKKNSTINSDDALISSLIQQAYSAFCSNSVFGIASYIGRRIRHGTFRGHLYSGVVNHLENLEQFKILRRDPAFSSRWTRWKEQFENEVKQIINDRLHVVSKQKPHGLLHPDNYTPHKIEILAASVRAISAAYAESRTTEGLDQVILDYCWRLAESDLQGIPTYLKSRQSSLKKTSELDEIILAVDISRKRVATEFKRESVHFIDTRLRAMYGWFKRPSNISPKASLALLYDAVVAEVKDTFPLFNPRTQISDLGDIELIGGAYHVLYDAFYVVVFNAAKHGDPSKPVRRRFSISVDNGKKRLEIEIANALNPKDKSSEVADIVKWRKEVDHSDANLYEQRSGIPKLMLLEETRKEFSVDFIDVVANDLIVRFSYALDH